MSGYGIRHENRLGQAGEFTKSVQEATVRHIDTVFPTPKSLMNHAHGCRQPLLISALTTPRFQDQVSRRLLAERVVAEERQDAWPLGDDRLPLVPLPAVVNFPHRPEPRCHILLFESEGQTPIAKMLAK